MRTISLLGSTGSIGRQSLDVIAACGMSVAAVAANRSVTQLEDQVRQFQPKLAVCWDESAAADLKTRIADTSTRVASGRTGLLEAATLPEADTVLTAVVGMIGLEPTLAAIHEKKRIALANKETLVYNDTVIAQLRSMGIVYARTTRSTHKFSLPDDFMQWHPTCHHRDALTDADAFLGSFDGYFSTPRLFYVWGHSHELRCEADWAHMEQLCEKIAHNDRIWYATNMEIYRYLTAQRSLVPAADESFVYNPTHTDVWIRKDGAPVCIRAGETHFF